MEAYKQSSFNNQHYWTQSQIFNIYISTMEFIGNLKNTVVNAFSNTTPSPPSITKAEVLGLEEGERERRMAQVTQSNVDKQNAANISGIIKTQNFPVFRGNVSKGKQHHITTTTSSSRLPPFLSSYQSPSLSNTSLTHRYRIQTSHYTVRGGGETKTPHQQVRECLEKSKWQQDISHGSRVGVAFLSATPYRFVPFFTLFSFYIHSSFLLSFSLLTHSSRWCRVYCHGPFQTP